MTAAALIAQLEPLGTESYRRILRNHGAKDPLLGVKVEELKKFQRKIKKDYQLALDLFQTGIYDAQYLAGLIADETRMTQRDLRRWLATGNSIVLCGTVVAWIAAESAHGPELALEWIESADENTAQTGWATLGSLIAITGDTRVDRARLTALLRRVGKTIHQQPNRVRYTMNGFVIGVGIYVPELTELAIQIGKTIGPVTVDMGDTACVVPFPPAYIEKAKKRGVIGKTRKTARC